MTAMQLYHDVKVSTDISKKLTFIRTLCQQRLTWATRHRAAFENKPGWLQSYICRNMDSLPIMSFRVAVCNREKAILLLTLNRVA